MPPLVLSEDEIQGTLTARALVVLASPILVALVGSLQECITWASTIIVVCLNLGGSVEMIPSPVAIAEASVPWSSARERCE
jgi:hypothetical protein